MGGLVRFSLTPRPMSSNHTACNSKHRSQRLGIILFCSRLYNIAIY